MQKWLLMYGMLSLTGALWSQDLKLPALSPSATISQDFSTSRIEVTYSRPSIRGRKIFGDVVPYGQVWRTGANAATKITFGEDVVIGGTTVKAGSYSFYTVPGEKEWEVIINTNTGSWGTNGYASSDDVVRMKVKPQSLSSPVETFTISIGNITFSSCDITVEWERTRIVVPVVANNQERIHKSIEKAVNNPSIPYQQAATYYFETNQHLDKALVYISKALEANPKAYWNFLLKARIAAKLGDKTTAREAAQKAMEVAKGTPGEAEYAKLSKALIDSL